MKKRNYVIDFFRMIFMIIICIHHFQGAINVIFIHSGYLCVEFFFILSGFYLFQNFQKNKKQDALQYTMKKVKRMYPHYIFSLIICLLTVVCSQIIKNDFDVVNITYKILAELFMIQNIGFLDGGLNTPIWYISVLIIGGYIIYGILKKDEKVFLRILGPVFIIFTFNLIKSNSNSIENWSNINGLYLPLLRGMADLMIGCLLAEILNRYSNKIECLIVKRKIIAFIVEISTYVLLAYIILFQTDYEMYCLILFPLLIMFAYCQKSISSKLFNKEIYKNNGDLTYAMYLNHSVVNMVMSFAYEIFLSRIFNAEIMTIMYVVVVIVYSYFTNKIVNYLTNKLRKLNNN